jgi:hypothetical protein
MRELARVVHALKACEHMCTCYNNSIGIFLSLSSCDSMIDFSY